MYIIIIQLLHANTHMCVGEECTQLTQI